jgi:hypothetical protein
MQRVMGRVFAAVAIVCVVLACGVTRGQDRASTELQASVEELDELLESVEASQLTTGEMLWDIWNTLWNNVMGAEPDPDPSAMAGEVTTYFCASTRLQSAVERWDDLHRAPKATTFSKLRRAIGAAWKYAIPAITRHRGGKA